MNPFGSPTLALAALLLIGGQIGHGAPAPILGTRPNIVLLVADDMGAEDCGPYGNARIRTPNLDRLAREGMRFDRAFLTCSSCSPSRASLMTGRYPHNTDAEQLHWPLPRGQVTFVEKLKQIGYWTAAAGKWHLGDEVKDRFDIVVEAGTSGFQLPADRTNRTGTAMIADKDESGCAHWLPTLQGRPRDKPFFLWFAAIDPHRDYRTNAIDRPHSPDDVLVPPFLPDAPAVRSDLALYYDEINRLDAHVGAILAELEAQGVASNTLVLFMSDNGRPFPRCKTTLYDSGIRSPLLARWPAAIHPGSVCSSLISAVDLAPTFLALAGLETPASFQGVNAARLLTDPTSRVRAHIFAEHNWHDYDAHGRAVRDERFKYIRNFDREVANTPPADAVRSPTFATLQALRQARRLTDAQRACFVRPKPAEELYDLEADPQELRNLAGARRHAARLREMRATLEEWQQRTADPVPGLCAPDEFDRETGLPLENRRRPRISKRQLQAEAK